LYATISDPLLDHLVGDGNEPRRHLDAKHFRVAGLMELELGTLHDWQVGRGGAPT
jgi:hypothetical protein